MEMYCWTINNRCRGAGGVESAVFIMVMLLLGAKIPSKDATVAFILNIFCMEFCFVFFILTTDDSSYNWNQISGN